MKMFRCIAVALLGCLLLTGCDYNTGYSDGYENAYKHIKAAAQKSAAIAEQRRTPDCKCDPCTCDPCECKPESKSCCPKPEAKADCCPKDAPACADKAGNEMSKELQEALVKLGMASYRLDITDGKIKFCLHTPYGHVVPLDDVDNYLEWLAEMMASKDDDALPDEGPAPVPPREEKEGCPMGGCCGC